MPVEVYDRHTYYRECFGAYLGMAPATLRIKVNPKDQKGLRELLGGAVQQVRVVLRALALLQSPKAVSAPRIASVVSFTPQGDSQDRPSLPEGRPRNGTL
jgi:hypothetical protein